MKRFDPRGLSAPVQGLYTCIWPPFSKTVWPIKAKSHVEPPWEEGKKVSINARGHMTKMATMPIYRKNLLKSFPTELLVLLA